MEEKLPDSVFCRVHKSYILNLNQIKSVDSKSVVLNSGNEIPVGESFKMNFMTKLK
jgi:DNA-binding LytR/AlgR family response regulator